MKRYSKKEPSSYLINFIKDIKTIFNTETQLEITQENVYDRKKALGILTSYISLMTELNTVDFHWITLKSEIKISDKD